MSMSNVLARLGKQTPSAAEEDEQVTSAEDTSKNEDLEDEEDSSEANAEDDDSEQQAEDDGSGDTDEDEEDESSDMKAASTERSRIRAITSHAVASQNPNLASHLAMNTGLSVKASGRILKAAALDTESKPNGGGLSERMRTEKRGLSSLPTPSGKSSDGGLAQLASKHFGSRKRLKSNGKGA